MSDSKCDLFFSAAMMKTGGIYSTIGTSRTFALVATAPNYIDARDRIYGIAESIKGPFEYRSDIALYEYANRLMLLRTSW